MNKTRIFVAALLIAVAIAVNTAGNMLPGILTTVRTQILEQSKSSLNGVLTLGEVRLSGFIKLTADDVKLTGADGEVVFQAKSVTAGVSLLKYLFNQDEPVKAVTTIIIPDDSELVLKMDEKQNWNISDLIKQADDKPTSFHAVIEIAKSKICLDLPQGRWLFNIAGDIDMADNPYFAPDLLIYANEDTIKLSGRMNARGEGRLRIVTKELMAGEFAPLVKDAINVDNIDGFLKNVDVIWENDGKGNVFNGQLEFSALSGDYLLAGNNLHTVLNGKMAVKQNKLTFPGLNALINEQKVDFLGTLALKDNVPVAEKLGIATDFAAEKLFANAPVKGDFSVKLLLDGPMDRKLEDLSANADVSFNKAVFDGVALDKGLFSLNVDNKRVFLTKGHIEGLGGNAEITGEYDTQTDSFLSDINIDKMDISGIPQADGARGVVSAQVSLSGKPSWDEMNFTASISAADGGYKKLALNDINIFAEKFGETVNLKYASGKIGKGNFNAAGKMNSSDVDIDVKVADIPLSEVLSAFGHDASGFLTGNVDLKGQWGNLAGDANLHAIDGVVEKQPFKTVTGKFHLSDRIFTAENVLFEMNYGVHYLSGAIDMSTNDPVFDVNIVSEAVRLEPIAALALPGKKITGNMDNFVSIKGPLSGPSVSGEVLAYEASYEENFIEKVVGRYSWSDKGLDLDHFNVKFMQTSIFLHGHADNDGTLNMKFEGDNIRLENLPPIDEVVLAGGVSLSGTLTGNMDTPVFNGGVSAKEVFVNGQAVNNIKGEAFSEGGLKNHTRITFSHDKGTYLLDAGLDYTERFAHGIMEVKNGNVNTLLKVAGYNTDIYGELSGTIELNPSGRRTGISLHADIDNGKVRDIPFERIDVNLQLHRGKLTINNFEAQQGTGRIIGKGTADFRGEIDIECGGTGLNASLITAFMQNPVPFSGDLSFLLQASGKADNPVVSASVQISPGSVAGADFDNLYGLFSFKDREFCVDQLFIAKGDYKISAYGKVPEDLFKKRADRKNPNSQMDLVLKLDNADLSLIPGVFANAVEWGIGKTEGELSVRGTLEQPEFYGGVNIKQGTLKFKYLRNPLENINLDIKFEKSHVIINKMEGMMGKGTVKAGGNIDIGNLSNINYHLTLSADKLGLSSDIVTGPLTANFEVTPQSIRDGTRPLIKGNIYLEHLLIDIPTIPEMGESDLNLGLDVHIQTGDKVRLYNKYLYDMLLEGDLRVAGSTKFTNVSGTARVKKGMIKYLSTPFKIDYASAGFPIPGSPMPSINLSARSKISGVDIYVSVKGPVDQMDLTLSSDPPLSQQEIFRLMTLKTRTRSGESSSNVTEDDMMSLASAALQMTFLGEIEDFLRNNWGLDEFRIFQGSIDTGVGMVVDAGILHDSSREDRDQYNVYIGKYLTDRLLISYTRSMISSADDEYRIALQYELSRRISLGTAIDEDHKMYYGLEYKVSF